MDHADFTPTENEYGGFWTGFVPTERTTFFGHQIRVEFPRLYELDGPSFVEGPEGNWLLVERDKIYEPEIQAAHFALWQRIDAKLPELVERVEAEMRLLPEMVAEPDLPAHFKDPHIWVDEHDDDPEQWSFVVGRDDWEDFGWHFNFRGTEFVDSFAGD